MPKIRILIADNCRDYVYLLVQLISAYREFEIVGVAYDGEQALEMIQQTRPDVLLLDIIMPNMDGMEVVRRIRKENKELKVIIMSALDSIELVENMVGAKIDHYFIKPFDFLISCPLLVLSKDFVSRQHKTLSYIET